MSLWGRLPRKRLLILITIAILGIGVPYTSESIRMNSAERQYQQCVVAQQKNQSNSKEGESNYCFYQQSFCGPLPVWENVLILVGVIAALILLRDLLWLAFRILRSWWLKSS